MLATHAVGIDLGTTYSCIAYLNERGEPVTLANLEGELCTPSVVLYEEGNEVVGTEALRNAIVFPDRVIQNAKRHMGDAKTWTIDGKKLTPVDVSTAIIRKLLRDARRQIGNVERAVITVPAQFSDSQREQTVKAGMMAGLKHVDIINEPVAAALCYVLGKEGLWFSELAEEKRIVVYDLGGGTFDLSLVKYHKNEVRVLTSTGDLQLGGIDWNQALLNAVADQFTEEFGSDPRSDPESLQHLLLEVEQCKRSLTTRAKGTVICQHAAKRKTYQIDVEQFNQLTAHLVKRTEEITRQLLKEDFKRGGMNVQTMLIPTGGSSRMPMVKAMLHKLNGASIDASLSPDQAIAHGAAYYAGMLLSNQQFAHSILNPEATARLAKVKQQSVTARGLGILVRNTKKNMREPHYMIEANTPLPASVTHTFGTVIPNQKRVMLRIVESGARAELPFLELGDCAIDGLPPNLPVDSFIAVTISYDESAKVHVSAKDVTSGKEATTQIIREENLLTREATDEEVVLMPVENPPVTKPKAASAPQPGTVHGGAVARTPAPATVHSRGAVRPNTPVPKAAPAAKSPVRALDASMQHVPENRAAAAPRVLRPGSPEAKADAARALDNLNAALDATKDEGSGDRMPDRVTVHKQGGTLPQSKLDEASTPVPLCNICGDPLNARGQCPACGVVPQPAKPKPTPVPVAPARPVAAAPKPRPAPAPAPRPVPTIEQKPPRPVPAPGPSTLRPPKLPDLDEILEPGASELIRDMKGKKPAPRPAPPKPPSKPRQGEDDGSEDFWRPITEA